MKWEREGEAGISIFEKQNIKNPVKNYYIITENNHMTMRHQSIGRIVFHLL